MKTFREFILTEDKYADSGIDVDDVKNKVQHHSKEADKLAKEIGKHKKTSKEYRGLANDITHHINASNSYREAHYRIKKEWSPGQVKEKIKSGEKHASKVSGHIPEVAASKSKIKNIHDHVHSFLTGKGYTHSSETQNETTHSTKRLTPYGDDRAFSQRGKRTNTIHMYTKAGTKADADKIKTDLSDVHGERGNHHVSVYHKNKTVTVTHHITGKSSPDHSYNEREYNYNTGAHNDPAHWGTRYDSWRKMR